MQLLATLTDEDVIKDGINKPAENFYKRQAARAIVFDKDGHIYLLHMSNYGYHKLPGGGIDEGEEVVAALFRELEEEIGCPADITAEVGEIKELRSETQWDQTSYCFLAKQAGELVPTDLEPHEIERGAKTVMVDSLDEAIDLLEQDRPIDHVGQFIKQRDLIFLRHAKKLVGA